MHMLGWLMQKRLLLRCMLLVCHRLLMGRRRRLLVRLRLVLFIIPIRLRRRRRLGIH